MKKVLLKEEKMKRSLKEEKMKKSLKEEKMKRSWIVLLSLTLVLAFSLTFALAGTVFAKAPADIGFTFPLTGPYGAYAEEMKRGVEIAVDEVNAKGGVMGQPVSVLIRDEELKADVALRRMKEFVDSGIPIVGGNLSGGVSAIVNQWAEKNKVLYMATCHNSIGQGADRTHYGFTSGLRSYTTGVALADYSFKHFGKKWMMIIADYRWGHDEAASFLVKSKEMGGEFLGAIYTPVGTTDFSAYVPQLLAKKPDFVVLSVFGSDLVSAVKQFGDLGLTKKMKFVLPKTAMPIIKECGAAYDKNIFGVVSWYWGLYKKYPNAKKFVDVYTKRYGRPPDADADSGYVGAMTVFMAMEKAGSRTDTEKIIKALENLKWNLNQGPEKYRACDHVREKTVVILQGKGAKAQGWDVADIVAEVPASKTLQSCDNDAKDLPYGPIRAKLPGK
jgi:branched-chain amino acid transport system substrate-binding protein